MNIGIYYTRPLKDKMVYKARNGIEIKIKGYGVFFTTFPMCRFKPLLFLYSMLWTIIVQGNVRHVQQSPELAIYIHKVGTNHPNGL